MSTSTQLRIGMIGVAGRGGLWRSWHQPNGRSVIVGGADINPAHLEKFSKDHGGAPFITSDYSQLISRDDIDAIAVTSLSSSPRHCLGRGCALALRPDVWSQSAVRTGDR